MSEYISKYLSKYGHLPTHKELSKFVLFENV